MPWRQIRPYPFHFSRREIYAPEGGWPSRRVWVTPLQAAQPKPGEAIRFGDWHLLRTRPLWQIAPLSPEFRKWAGDPDTRFEAWEMAETPQDPAFALVYRFRGNHAHYQKMPITADGVVMGHDRYTAGIMGGRIFFTRREFHAFSSAVDYLEGRDPETQRSLSVMPIENPVDDDLVTADVEGL